MKPKLKICGLKDPDNIREVLQMSPDFIGLIFYKKSPRYVGDLKLNDINTNVPRVGVFVNSSLTEIMKASGQFGLTYIQLHGEESQDLARQLRGEGLKVIKVFSVSDQLPASRMEAYLDVTDFFLLDTRTSEYGGSGRKFDWDILQNYSLDKPYFLSGGISEHDIEDILRRDLHGLFAIDINSRIEIIPGVKDVEKIQLIKKKLQ